MEEIGSPTLPPFIKQNADLLQADMIFSSMAGGGLTSQARQGLKGLVGCELTVTGANGDKHSGMHGGGIANLIHALSHIIASMKGLDGRITIDGFKDDAVELTVEDREAIARVPFDEDEYAAKMGVPEPFGEAGYTVAERLRA